MNRWVCQSMSNRQSSRRTGVHSSRCCNEDGPRLQGTPRLHCHLGRFWILIRIVQESLGPSWHAGPAPQALASPIAVVCAKREYENWFLASAEGFDGDVEEFGGAKDWLTRRMPPGLAYKETRHQASLYGHHGILKRRSKPRGLSVASASALEELVCCIDTGTVSVTPCP